ncbi:Phage portal protein, lambda family [Symmachiella dynata]|uniref:phage portal protein n=1 Tax=Symmachiella dynata TaxID=2527995 RepID=UPI0011897275|nr:phage portal protein [Symmachiella dynata]QDT47181.1 Phage portal protein, lambda family [Symmachiella dynata]
MLGYLRDRWRVAALRARYARRVQERLLNLVETSGPLPVSEDPGKWTLLGPGSGAMDAVQRTDLRARARQLAMTNSHARNVIRLLEIYVVGPGLKLSHGARQEDAAAKELAARADAVWAEFLRANQRHFSYREYGRRAWRDGECFLRMFRRPAWPPSVRFVDPETVATPAYEEESEGIITEPDDVETPVAYQRVDAVSLELREEIPAAEMLHTKLGADSNQKRGVTILAPAIETLESFDKWLETELLARRLQSSIVLWRKVQGSPSEVASVADGAQHNSRTDPYGTVRNEKVRAGTILTTSQGTDLQFLQPDTNFGDAVPMGRLLLLCLAAGQGLPEFMLTCDASNANFASTMVAEGPAVKLFQAEQQFFVAEFERLWRWVMSEAIRSGLLPDDFHDQVMPHWSAPELVNRDRPRERLADARLCDAGILSKAEVARRDGADPELMRAEREEE